MSDGFDFENAETWVPNQGTFLPEGNWVVTITSAEPATSKQGNPQILLQIADSQGREKKDWQTYGEATGVSKVATLFRSAGVQLLNSDVTGGVISPAKVAQLVGRSVGVVMRDEPSFKDPSKVYAEVQGYLPPEDVRPLAAAVAPVAAGATDPADLPF